jgi:hypothetical protein
MSTLRKISKVLPSYLIGIAVLTAAYLFLIRPWHRNWGASRIEVGQPMPGDELVPRTNYLTTRAVAIKGEPEDIWPWLVQMGYKRGGLYSYDWLDRAAGILDRPSAIRILPEFQNLKPGDKIPIGGGPGWLVHSLEPNKSMVLDIKQPGVHISWSFQIYPADLNLSRLVLRIRGYLEPPGPLLMPLFVLLDPAEFIMVRRMLTGIKQRVERTAGTPTDELLELLAWAVALLIFIAAALGALTKKDWDSPYMISWFSILAFLFMAFWQPSLIVAFILDVALLFGLGLALRGRL